MKWISVKEKLPNQCEIVAIKHFENEPNKDFLDIGINLNEIFPLDNHNIAVYYKGQFYSLKALGEESLEDILNNDLRMIGGHVTVWHRIPKFVRERRLQRNQFIDVPKSSALTEKSKKYIYQREFEKMTQD